MTTGARVDGRGHRSEFQALYQNNFVGPGYFAAMGIGIVKGRDFRDDDRRGAPPVIVINEEFARRYFPKRDPIGASVRLPGPSRAGYLAEIVGVVRDSKYRTIGEEQRPAMLRGLMPSGQPDRIGARVRADGRWPVCSSREVATRAGRAWIRQRPLTSSRCGARSRLRSCRARSAPHCSGRLARSACCWQWSACSRSCPTRSAGGRPRLASAWHLERRAAAVMRLVLRDAMVIAIVGCAIGLVAAWFITSPLSMFLVSGLSASDPDDASWGRRAPVAAREPGGGVGSGAPRAAVDPVSALRAE